ncbi:hypothetical protein RvY_04692 [Ramazzottius varieornatus]|uniref:Major facilitator superfamily (MFS) profile domain-containing protein n=1 Tax=Ramazzottius varieornatus TaxID=947166 RepID=A0A1D1USI3_RAMVA|nr:hypothetical protein RvY_04692 [Ramazzottius varieornatus]
MGLGENGNSPLTATLLFAVLITSFGTWFPVGFVTVAMNGPQSVIVNWLRSVQCSKFGGTFGHVFNRTNGTEIDSDLWTWCRHILEEDEPFMLSENLHLSSMWAVGAAVVNVGGLASIFVVVPLVKMLGLKRALLLISIMNIISIGIFCLAPVLHLYEIFVVGRIVIGFTGAMFMTVTPMYISEISPVVLRGAMCTIPMLLMVTGSVTGSGLGLPEVLGNSWGWVYLMGVPALPSMVLLVLLPFCPESPRRLFIVKQDKAAAKKALVWLRRTEEVECELEGMQYELDNRKHQHQLSVTTLFKDKLSRSSLWLAIMPTVARQSSGNMVFAFYSTSIFTGVGLSNQGANFTSLGLWALCLMGTLLSLVLVDRAGRKTLLLVGHAGIIVSLALFVTFSALTKEGYEWAKYGNVACVFVFFAFFQAGIASVAFVLPSELFSQEARSAATSLVSAVGAAGSLITTLCFPLLVPILEEYTYIIFIGCLLFTGTYLAWNLPETKGRTINEIQSILRKKLL